MTNKNNTHPLRAIMEREEYHQVRFEVGKKEKVDPTKTKLSLHNRSLLMPVIPLRYRKMIPNDFDWTLVVNNGDVRGKLSDRLAKLFDVTSLRRIGYCATYLDTLIDKQVRSDRYAVIDWTFDIDWVGGDFGDGGSCYFPPGGYVRAMHQNGIGAIRRWRQYDKENKIRRRDNGWARAWMIVDEPRLHDVIIYNTYGNCDCNLFAKWLAETFDNLGFGKWDTSRDSMSICGTAYINGDKAFMWDTALHDGPPSDSAERKFEIKKTVKL